MSLFKVGQEVYTKQGFIFTIRGFEGNMAFCAQHETVVDSESGDSYSEPGEQIVMLPVGELLEKQPEFFVPQYLQNHIARAERTLKSLVEEQTRTRNEIAELNKQRAQMRVDVNKFPDMIKRQLVLLQRHLDGEDLLMCYFQYGKMVLKRMSELKDSEGDLRLVSLYGSYKPGKGNKWLPLYDWTVHQYSDDSGSKERALVAGDEDEMRVRMREYLDAKAKAGLDLNVQELVAIRDFGVALHDRETLVISQWEKSQEKQREEQLRKQRERVLRDAKELGLNVGLPS